MIHSFISRLWKSFLETPLWLKIFTILAVATGTWFRVEGLAVDGYFFDMVETQYEWGKESWERGMIGFWQTYDQHYDYPVISLIYEYILYGLTHNFVSEDLQPWRLFVAIHKLLNWIIEIGAILWIGVLARRYAGTSKNILFVVCSFLYAIPALWFVSGVWGQNDTLMAVLALVSIFVFFKNSFAPLDLTTTEVPLFKDYRFWSGFVWACSLFVKQQTLLLIPLFFFLFIAQAPKQKIWQAFRYTVLVILTYGSAAVVYAYGEWLISAIMIGIYFTASLIILYMKSKQHGYWQQLFRFLTGWLTVTWLCSVPWMFLNYMLLARVNLAFAIRGDGVYSGATNIWYLFTDKVVASELLFNASWSPSVKLSAYIIFLSLLAGILITIFRIKPIDFLKGSWDNILTHHKIIYSDAVFILIAINSLYYFLLPGGHSRYLHIGLICWVVFFLLKKVALKLWFVPWLVLTAGYTMNQASTYTGVSSHDPQWVRTLVESAPFNVNLWGGYIMLTMTVVLVGIGIRQYSLSNHSDSSSSSSSISESNSVNS